MVNITTFTNGTDGSLVGYAQAIDTESGGLFGLVLIIVIYVISYVIANKDGDSKNAFVVSAFLGGLTSIILRLSLIIKNDTIVFVSIVLMVIAGLLLVWRKDSG